MITDKRFEAMFNREPLKKRPAIKSIPTKRLKEIIDNEGYNYQHTKDYGPYLEDIKAELLRRYKRQDEIRERKLSNEMTSYLARIFHEGITCIKCHEHADFENLPSKFYVKKDTKTKMATGAYYTTCKECTKNAVKERRALAKTETPF